MKQWKLASLALVGAVGLAACADDSMTPIAPTDANPTPAPMFSATADASAEETGNHLIVFNSTKIPAGFADKVAAVGGSVVSTHEVVGAMLVSGLDEQDVTALRSTKGVQTVELEPIIQLPEVQGIETEQMGGAIASPSNPAGAFFWGRQWNMRTIDADDAWAAGHLGSSDVTVAILDTGIDYGYPDLQGRVDLSRSISLQPQDDALVAAYFPGKHPITDLHYHGTHVAATVASNGYVAAGVTSQTTLIGVKVCSVYGGCTRIFEGIEYAVNNDADIINMSLGGSFQKRDYPGYVSVINRYINYANQQGVLLVVSAGNSAIDLDHDKNGYKTYCNAPHAVCVSATGPTGEFSRTGPWENIDAPASYTNYGRSAINVAGPGGNSGGYVYAACSQTSLAIPVCQTGNYIVGLAGTSMAAPHVSGVAALIMAKEGTGRPSQTINTLQKSADDLGQRGTDPYYGKGRVNAAAAVGL